MFVCEMKTVLKLECRDSRRYLSTWCSSAKRENFNHFTLSCFNHFTLSAFQLRHKNTMRVAHYILRKKLTRKSTLEYKLDYDEHISLSRSNTGTTEMRTRRNTRVRTTTTSLPPGTYRSSRWSMENVCGDGCSKVRVCLEENGSARTSSRFLLLLQLLTIPNTGIPRRSTRCGSFENGCEHDLSCGLE